MIRLRPAGFAVRGPVFVIVAVVLAGCASRGPGSVAGGECKIFERPQYEVRGAAPYDQDWIDSQVEGGVGGCKWQRPALRPAELDAPARPIAAPAPVKRRPGLIRRIRNKILPPRPAAAPAPTFPAVAAPIVPTPTIAVTPPAPPRAAVDELLDPRPLTVRRVP